MHYCCLCQPYESLNLSTQWNVPESWNRFCTAWAIVYFANYSWLLVFFPSNKETTVEKKSAFIICCLWEQPMWDMYCWWSIASSMQWLHVIIFFLAINKGYRCRLFPHLLYLSVFLSVWAHMPGYVKKHNAFRNCIVLNFHSPLPNVLPCSNRQANLNYLIAQFRLTSVIHLSFYYKFQLNLCDK